MSPKYSFYIHKNGDVSLFPQGKNFPELLGNYLKRVNRSSRYYGNLIQNAGASIDSNPVGVFDVLPYTNKELYRHMLTREALEDIRGASFVTDFSSGSVSDPVIRVCTSHDDLCEQEITESTFKRARMGQGDRLVCIDVGAASIYDFYLRAARNIGVSNAHILHLTSQIQSSVQPLRKLRPNVILTLPSLLKRMWPALKVLWSLEDCPVRLMIMMGEPIDVNFRRVVEETLHCKVLSFYGTTEIGGLAGECEHQNGHHFNPEFVVPTIKAPIRQSDDTVSGEVVYTTLHEHTHSVIKYEVGDIVKLSLTPCSCGESTPRLWFIERTNEAFILAGEKFSYNMFFDTFADAVPDIEIMSVEIFKEESTEGAQILSFNFPTSIAPHEDAIRNLLQKEIFGLDSLYRYGFVKFNIVFKPASEFADRKLCRLIDHRGAHHQ